MPKFLKEDGTIEEGTLLTDAQASMLEHLEEYLHNAVCRNSYHGLHASKPCREAAEWGEVFDEKVNLKPVEPPPISEPAAVVVHVPDDIPF